MSRFCHTAVALLNTFADFWHKINLLNLIYKTARKTQHDNANKMAESEKVSKTIRVIMNPIMEMMGKKREDHICNNFPIVDKFAGFFLDQLVIRDTQFIVLDERRKNEITALNR